MNSMTIMYQARMYSLVAQMEGMIAANQARLREGLSVAYSEDHFTDLSVDFERLAESLAECASYWAEEDVSRFVSLERNY